MEMEIYLRAKVLSLLHGKRDNFSLTADAWFLRIFSGYVVVTAQFLDENWKLMYFNLDIKQFQTLHSLDSVQTFLKDVIMEWEVEKHIKAVATDNEEDIVGSISLLLTDLQKIWSRRLQHDGYVSHALLRSCREPSCEGSILWRSFLCINNSFHFQLCAVVIQAKKDLVLTREGDGM